MNDTRTKYDWSGKPIPYVITDEFTQYPPKELSEVEKLREENAKLRAELEAIYSTEPVAWMRADGEDGSLSTMTECCSQKVKDLWLKCSPVQVERYTIPLIPLPVRKS
jgi:hypothetical protein